MSKKALFHCSLGHQFYLEDGSIYHNPHDPVCANCSDMQRVLDMILDQQLPKAEFLTARNLTENILCGALSSAMRTGDFKEGSVQSYAVEEDPHTDDPLDKPFDRVEISFKYEIPRRKETT